MSLALKPRWLVFLGFVTLAGCGPQASPPSTPIEEGPADVTDPSVESAEASSTDLEGEEALTSEPSDAEASGADPSKSEASDPSAPVGASESASKPDTSPREVRYRMTPQGMKIEVENVEFQVSAAPVRIPSGWGVKVTAKAQVLDNQRHSLLTPKGGPLAFAGEIKKKGGKLEKFTDQREGDTEKILEGGQSYEFSRTWPKKGGHGIYSGQSLSIDVGLWGIGDTAETRRPVRKFFLVRMTAGNRKPNPVVTPPEDLN